MDLVIKHFDELTKDELFDIIKLRISVFVVEQNCAYQEVDDYDRTAYHLYLKDDEGIQAYLRVLDRKTFFDSVSIGRVISVKRRSGLATKLIREGIKIARERFHADDVVLEAQTYAKSLYEKIGFQQISDEFVEDGIPHVKMRLLF